MKIYMLRSDTANFASIVPDNDDDWDKLGVLDEGVSVKNWLPIKMQWINENEGSNDLPHGDFPSLATNIPVFSARACEILNKHFSLNDYGQFLEVNIEGETYYLFNVTCLRNNIIDEKKSIILRFVICYNNTFSFSIYYANYKRERTACSYLPL